MSSKIVYLKISARQQSFIRVSKIQVREVAFLRIPGALP